LLIVLHFRQNFECLSNDVSDVFESEQPQLLSVSNDAVLKYSIVYVAAVSVCGRMVDLQM